MHLMSDKLHHLARLVTEDLAFSTEDVRDMEHIARCEQCFEALQIHMTVLTAVDNVDLFDL